MVTLTLKHQLFALLSDRALRIYGLFKYDWGGEEEEKKLESNAISQSPERDR